MSAIAILLSAALARTGVEVVVRLEQLAAHLPLVLPDTLQLLPHKYFCRLSRVYGGCFIRLFIFSGLGFRV